MLEWRLKAYRQWLKMEDPTRRAPSERWAKVSYPDIDYQSVVYYSAPKKKELSSLDEVDPELLETDEKLGIPLEEQKMLAGVAVDAVFDSVSVATTFKDKLSELGIIVLLFFRSGEGASRTRQKISGFSRSGHGQLFCSAQLRRIHRWLICVYPQGRALSHGAIDLFSHQCGQHRTV